MIEWIKNLELEFVIIFGLLAILVLVSIVVLIKTQRTLNLIGKRALILKEDLIQRDGHNYFEVMVANTSYVNVEAAAIGLIYKKKLMPLKEETTIILARDSFKLSIPLEAFRSYVIGSETKVKKAKVYVEDSLGRRSLRKIKNSLFMLRKILKAELKAKRIEEKKIRFENGNYRFGERVALVITVIFSPITRLFRAMKLGLNRRLKAREIRLELKQKELDHQKMLREIAEEERGEEDRAKLEKRLMEEKKKANVEARMAALKRKEEARALAEEVKKTEEELRLAEAEAMLHTPSETVENEDDYSPEQEQKPIQEKTDETTIEGSDDSETKVIEEVKVPAKKKKSTPKKQENQSEETHENEEKEVA
jgi:hypothetical protein